MKRRILLSSGKFLATVYIARAFRAAGHEVIIADASWWTFCRFSNAAEKNYVIPSPRFETEKAIDKLVEIIKKERIDLYIPIWEEGLYVAQYLDRFPSTCEVFCSSFETMHQMHNKWLFNRRLAELGLPAARSQLVASSDDLAHISLDVPYALKACYSRSSQRVYKVEGRQRPPEVNVEPHNPWIAQEWLHGKKYCTSSLCRNGAVTAHMTYPIVFSRNGDFCLHFKSVDHPAILSWVQQFVASQNYTGQLGVDFIESPTGELYAIDCNPRCTLGLMTFGHEELANAYLNTPDTPYLAPFGSACQTSFGMMFYAWRSQPFRKFIKALFTTPDPLFWRKDLGPTFALPLIYLAFIGNCIRHRTNLITDYTRDIDWDGEAPTTQQPMRYSDAS